MPDSTPNRGHERLALLADMTSLFAAGVDEATTLQGVVKLFVPDFAAWAAIDLVDEGELARVAFASIDFPDHRAAAHELQQRAQSLHRPETQALLASDRARIVQVDSTRDMTWPSRSEAHTALYRDALPLSIIFAPLRASGAVFGILQVVSIHDHRRYTAEDASLVDDIAQRASFAINTVRLVAQLQRELAAGQASAARLEESEQRYRRMFESNPYPLWVYDDDTLQFLMVNSAAVRQYGFSVDEFLRIRIVDIRPPHDTPLLEQSLRQRMVGLRTAGVFRHQRKDGSTFLAEIRSHGVEFSGRPARMVQALDVTDRVRAYEAMRVAEERHRLVSRVTKEAIWEWNPVTDSIEWNPLFFDLFRFAPREVEHTRSWVESRMHPDDRESASAELTDALRHRREQYTHRYRFLRGDGQYARVENRAIIAWNGDVAERVIGSMADITEQHEISEQLAIAQRMEAVGRLAGGVAHDFNNLLTAIRGFASFALDEQLPSSPARDDIDQVLQAADRAAALTRQLLAFSRRQVLQPQLVSVNEILTNLERMLARVLGEDVEVQTFLEPALAEVVVDAGQLEQVIMNLVVNARDAMPDGGILTIETSNVHLDASHAEAHDGATEGDYISIAITDTGVGMDARTMERIFEPFFSTKDRDRGTGLGLATSYGIIKQSGGQIGVYSEPGKGSTFRVYLPQAAAGETARPAAAREETMRATGTETILVVEDDDRVRRVSASALARHGYRVLEARSAEAAIAIFRDEIDPIALVVSDIVLPRMNGPALARELRATRPGLKVLFVSGYTEQAVLQSGALASGVELLEKPFAPDALARKVRAILDRPTPA